MKKIIVALVLALLIGGQGVATAQYPLHTIGSIQPASASGSLDTVDETATLNLLGFPGAAIQISGTWVGTVTFEVSIDGTTYAAANFTPPNSTTAATSATGNGIWAGSVVGYKYLRARFSTATSGTAVVSLRATLGGGAGGGGAAGGGGEVTNAGTFAVQVDGAALTALQLIDNLVLAEDAVHASGAPGVQILGVRQDSQVDLCADGDYCPFTIDGDGNLRVTMAGGTGGTALADDADFTAGTTSFTPVGGFYQSAVTACTDGDTCAAGITAQRTLKVTNYTAAGAEIPVSTTTEAAISSAVTAAGVGGYAMGVRRDTAASSADTDGDNTIASFDSTGRIWANVSNTVTVAAHNVTNAGTFATQVDGAALTALQLIDDAQTGDSVHYRTSGGATEDEHEIKGTAGRLFSVAFTNTAATVSYVKCHNLTAANTTPGTSAVLWAAAIPGASTGAGFVHSFGPNGLAFSTALTCTFVKGAADTDVAEVGANEIKATYTYK